MVNLNIAIKIHIIEIAVFMFYSTLDVILDLEPIAIGNFQHINFSKIGQKM